MAARSLYALDAPAGAAEVDAFLPRLAAALDGSGPALLPLPPGPPAVRDALLEAFDPSRPLEHDDVALVVPTSGSTGEPKGALLTASAVRASAHATHERLGGAGQWLLALPCTHVAGLMVLARSLDAGTRPVVADLRDGFDAQAFRRAAANRPRYTALVPTQLRRLLDHGVDLRGFDAVLLGGAAPPPDLLARARASGARVTVTYGMSETCGGCVYDGLPLQGVSVAVGDDGRVRIGGPTVFAGYRLRPDLTASVLADGVLTTNDVGRVTGDGRLEVLGRADDVVISGGVNVPAASVEQVLADHPDVRHVAVVGETDPVWGERVVAVVEARSPQRVPTLADLRAFARDRLPAQALPREAVVVGRLPLLPSGKPDKPAVRTLVAARRTP